MDFGESQTEHTQVSGRSSHLTPSLSSIIEGVANGTNIDSHGNLLEIHVGRFVVFSRVFA
jgi:hypothetical protein